MRHSVLSAVDSMKTDTGGYYIFHTADTAVYLVAVPDSANYPNEMETYYDSALTFQSAAIIHPKLGTTVVSFSTIGGANSSGGSFIGGTITICNCKKPGKGQPVPGLRVILVDSANSPVREATTDKYGAFGFGSLAAGTYKIWVDYPHLDNTLAPVINLAADSKVNKDLVFWLTPTLLELDTLSAIAQVKNTEPDIKIYPNPATSTLTIESTANPIQTITIYDATGRVVNFSKVLNFGKVNEISVANLPAGVYMLRLGFDNGSETAKFMKQ